MAKYDDRFYANRKRYHKRIERAVTELLKLIPKPESAVDLGCGDAHWLRALHARGTESLLGVEGFEACLPYTEPVPTIIHDLRKPLHLHLHFDLVLCIEVAEHLPAQSGAQIVATCKQLAKPGRPIVFSAAHPGQGGVGHINLRPQSYWRSLFERGDTAFAKVTYPLREAWEQANIMSWLYENVMVFSRHT